MSASAYPPTSLRAFLNYAPVPLQFGTSGRRGRVVDLTQLEVYLNVFAELRYLQNLPAAEGGIQRGDQFYFAYDLRPSSTRFVPELGGRGEIAQAVVQAAEDAGMTPLNLGAIPTPALAAHALHHHKGCIMVTGSHIPFDRNGYKTYSSRGELRKSDEAPILQRVAHERERLYTQVFHESLFDENGMFKRGHRDLPLESPAGRRAYARRYVNFFSGSNLQGMRLLVYQHSAVGRDLLVEVLQALGATVVPAGRSEEFVAVDTENVHPGLLQQLQTLLDEATVQHGRFEAVLSTDGDSDRPLLLGVTPEGRVRFFGGDLLGMVTAEYLQADAVVVPITCNDAVDRGPLRECVQPRTRIGSPHVIAGLHQALARGRTRVCGWEANGGFLTASDLRRGPQVLTALPTRDAFLPLLCCLFAAREQGMSLCELFARLPARYSQAGLLPEVPRAASLAALQPLQPEDPQVVEADWSDGHLVTRDAAGGRLPASPGLQAHLEQARARLAGIFAPEAGFGALVKINYLDGLRLHFANGDVAHVRPSGNADELRIYAVADTPERAAAIVREGVAEPAGFLRRLVGG
ncbi:MAG: phosphomannomutase [Verrucomicrobiae bacterium]|nr:phosphomannomutase [Verrucomicrobiae bacterium]